MKPNPSAALLAFACLAVANAGCSERPAAISLNPDERARYVYEIIEPREACEPLRKKLQGKFESREAVDALYEEAKKTGCLRREV